MDDSATWVDNVVSHITSSADGILTYQIGGVQVSTEVGLATLKFFKERKEFLLRLGLETFRDFLYLVHTKRNEEAFLLISSKMDADDIITQLALDAESLKEHNDNFDQFKVELWDFVKIVLVPIVTKVLIGLLI